jgi:3-dehydroquinate synthase
MSTLNVELKKVIDDSYEIEIGRELVGSLRDDLRNGLIAGIHKFAVITDSNVELLYARPVYEMLKEEGYQADLFVFPAGEKSKTRRTKAMLEDEMLAKGYRRDCCVIAVGGGVVTDLSGFLAGTFARGVPFVNYATTLLAAADASVGGKTAVDTDLATNLIGLINQPKKVYIDIASFATLERRQISSGLAETIKHACMADAEFFEYLEAHLEDVFENDPEVLEHISQKNAQIKYKVVMEDEQEKSLREILNLGHTVGRAIETVSEYTLSHGEAVAIGLVAQMKLGETYGYVTEEQTQRVSALLERAYLPVKIPETIDREVLVRKLYTDKKVRDGKLRFVFQKGIGEIVAFPNGKYAKEVTEDEARRMLERM